MLQELTIQNLALIQTLQLHFHPGFTTLTGETGAGKSILLDALGLCLGERAESRLVRHNTPRAEVSAQFNIEHLHSAQRWLKEHELNEDDCCVLRRTVTPEGRSKAYINGRPVPASQLKSLGQLLIDIHGQQAHQSLLSHTKQLELLDAYGAHTDLAIDCQHHYHNWKTLQTQLKTAQDNQKEHQNKLELLHFQLKEFETVHPLEGEFETLSKEQHQLSHASEIQTTCQQAYNLIEGETGAVEQLNHSISQLETLTEISPPLASLVQQLNSALIEMQEAASEIQQHSAIIELDPQRLQELEERLSQLFGLAKKYNIAPEELVTKQQQLQQSLEQLTHSEHQLETLKQDCNQAWQAFQTQAQTLQQARKDSATALSKAITQSMQTLGMPNGKFEVHLEPLSTPNASGLDKATFYVTTNPGHPPQPLAKIASGGELSRISLAIQVATAEITHLPTLIFDEVDVGIGGAIAEVVGKKMQQLGAHKQILSITHLAQVAAHGHQHLRIEKQTHNQQTFTQVTELSHQERIEELARMLGGLTLTQHTLKHAKEMLDHAHKTVNQQDTP